MRGSQKYVLVLLSAVFAVGAIFAGMIYSKAKLPKDESTTAVTVQKKQASTVEDLFYDSTHVFLATSISDEAIEKVKSNSGDDQDQLMMLDRVTEKWELQKKLNKLFDEPVLAGNKINESAKVKATVSEAEKESVLSELASSGLADGFASAVQSALASNGMTDSSSAIGSVTEEEAREKLDAVIADGRVVDGFSLEGYISARDTLDKLPPSSEKTKMSAELKLVEEVLLNMGYDLSAF